MDAYLIIRGNAGHSSKYTHIVSPTGNIFFLSEKMTAMKVASKELIGMRKTLRIEDMDVCSILMFTTFFMFSRSS